MTRHDILMLAVGAVAGAAITAVAGYFGVYRHYIPMRQLEHELDDLRERKVNAEQELKDIYDKIEHTMESHDGLLKSYREKENELSDRLNFYENELDVAQKKLETAQAQSAVTSYSSMFRPGDPDPDDVDEGESVEMETDDEPEDPSGRYVIRTGNTRVDGVVSEADQRKIDDAADGDEVQVIIDSIIEERFDNSINEDEPSYMITAEQHEDAPWFIDTEELSYYEGDDILAMDRTIVLDIERLINPIVLNHFGRNSGSGDPNVVWCRNDVNKMDYCITRYEGSYQHLVLGVPETERDRPPKFRTGSAVAMEEAYDHSGRA